MSKVGIVIGSKTDKPIIESTEKVLDNYLKKTHWTSRASMNR